MAHDRKFTRGDGGSPSDTVTIVSPPRIFDETTYGTGIFRSSPGHLGLVPSPSWSAVRKRGCTKRNWHKNESNEVFVFDGLAMVKKRCGSTWLYFGSIVFWIRTVRLWLIGECGLGGGFIRVLTRLEIASPVTSYHNYVMFENVGQLYLRYCC